MTRKTLAIAGLLVALSALTACGSDDDRPASANVRFNAADVAFATGMIPHHQQAVEMAEIAEDRAESPEVRQLARDIKAAQGPEIQTMTGWLKEWGQEVPSGSMDHGSMGHGSSEEMPGTMDAAEMGRLEQSDGAEFDQMFLRMMIEHHRGAIEMARVEQANGKNPDALALAEKVETDQEAEIEKMEQLLGS